MFGMFGFGFKLLKWILIIVAVIVVWTTVTGTFAQIYWWMAPDGHF